MQTVVETPTYLADAERLLSSAEQKAIVDRLAADPGCGVVMQGTGGVRKVRFGFGGRGKSGGAPIVYLFGGEDVPISCWQFSSKTRRPILPSLNAMPWARPSVGYWMIIGEENDKKRVR